MEIIEVLIKSYKKLHSSQSSDFLNIVILSGW